MIWCFHLLLSKDKMNLNFPICYKVDMINVYITSMIIDKKYCPSMIIEKKKKLLCP